MRFALIWGEVANGLRRNASMVISVILVTFISLTFVGTAILLQMQIGQMKSVWYDKAQVAVYLCTDVSAGGSCADGEVSAAQIDQVKSELDGSILAPFIENYFFENHDEAFANFQKQFAGNPVAEYVTADQLNQTFWVKLKDPSQSQVLIETLTARPGVEAVTDQRQYLDKIFAVLNAASYSAIGVAALMLVAAVLLIATTIRLSAFSRRRELGIMRLVGASNTFIQTPFILEGVIAALIGSLMAGGAIVAIVQFFVQGYLRATLPSTSFIGLTEGLIVVPILVIIGCALAAISAKFAISRYLKI